ncbi:hypothetical protein SAMN05216535_0584 [Stutzerimonas xanthomarina]|uniref:Uncharacterized protein n=1 Tax=Stutzerimonas xanthomarina TaxID=271420 RepID=A0ABY0ZRM1_9GAMM|nr:hypothetical protein SAMN05216535_0584 [Stutzerimonas xanthomarina]
MRNDLLRAKTLHVIEVRMLGRKSEPDCEVVSI